MTILGILLMAIFVVAPPRLTENAVMFHLAFGLFASAALVAGFVRA